MTDDLPPDVRELADQLALLFADEPDWLKRYALVRDAVRDFQQDLKLKRRSGEVVSVDLVHRFEHRLWNTLKRHLEAR